MAWHLIAVWSLVSNTWHDIVISLQSLKPIVCHFLLSRQRQSEVAFTKVGFSKPSNLFRSSFRYFNLRLGDISNDFERLVWKIIQLNALSIFLKNPLYKIENTLYCLFKKRKDGRRWVGGVEERIENTTRTVPRDFIVTNNRVPYEQLPFVTRVLHDSS